MGGVMSLYQIADQDVCDQWARIELRGKQPKDKIVVKAERLDNRWIIAVYESSLDRMKLVARGKVVKKNICARLYTVVDGIRERGRFWERGH